MKKKDIQNKYGITKAYFYWLVNDGKIIKDVDGQYQIDENYFETFDFDRYRNEIKLRSNIKRSKSIIKCWSNKDYRKNVSNSHKVRWSNMSNEKRQEFSITMSNVAIKRSQSKEYLSKLSKAEKESFKRKYENFTEDERLAYHKMMSDKGKLAGTDAAILKSYYTKKSHGTFRYSKPVKECLLMLDGLTYETEKLYPNSVKSCDLYISDYDAWIEFNFFPCHGSESFDETNKRHLEKLRRLKQSTTKKDKRTVEVWSKSDVERKKLAEQLGLYWIAFYSVEDFSNWLNSMRKQNEN